MAEMFLSFVAGVIVGAVTIFLICFKVIREVYRLAKLQGAVTVAPDPTVTTTGDDSKKHQSTTN